MALESVTLFEESKSFMLMYFITHEKFLAYTESNPGPLERIFMNRSFFLWASRPRLRICLLVHNLLWWRASLPPINTWILKMGPNHFQIIKISFFFKISFPIHVRLCPCHGRNKSRPSIKSFKTKRKCITLLKKMIELIRADNFYQRTWTKLFYFRVLLFVTDKLNFRKTQNVLNMIQTFFFLPFTTSVTWRPIHTIITINYLRCNFPKIVSKDDNLEISFNLI